MSIGPIANLAGGYLQSIISPALRSAGLTSTTSTSTSGAGASQPDNGQLSPFAQVLNTLQQLQQSNPSQYGQVTQQIATNLQSAAQTAQANGNTTAASALNTLANDFTSASQSGQLPNVQDIAKAMGGGVTITIMRTPLPAIPKHGRLPPATSTHPAAPRTAQAK